LIHHGLYSGNTSIPDIFAATIFKHDFRDNRRILSHILGKPFEVFGRNPNLDIQRSRAVYPAQLLPNVNVLTYFNSLLENPAIKRRDNAGSFKIQLGLLIHDPGHITRGYELFLLGSYQGQLVVEGLKTLLARQIGLFGFVQLGLGEDLPVNKFLQS